MQRSISRQSIQVKAIVPFFASRLVNVSVNVLAKPGFPERLNHLGG